MINLMMPLPVTPSGAKISANPGWFEHVCTSEAELLNPWTFKVVLEGYRRCPDSYDMSECHLLYDLGRHM